MNVTWATNFVMIMTIYHLIPELNSYKKIPIYSLSAAWNATGNLRMKKNRTNL
jgi:hypothetical protein